MRRVMVLGRDRELDGRSERAGEQCEPIARPNEREKSRTSSLGGRLNEAMISQVRRAKMNPASSLRRLAAAAARIMLIASMMLIASPSSPLKKQRPHPMIALEMPDLRLDRTASSPPPPSDRTHSACGLYLC